MSSSPESGSGRSRAWVVYAVLAILALVGAFTTSESRGFALAAAALLGLYARYLYRGGRIVFMPIPGCLIALLFPIVLFVVAFQSL